MAASSSPDDFEPSVEFEAERAGEPTETPQSPAAKGVSVILGLFILGQLCFLLTKNLVGLAWYSKRQWPTAASDERGKLQRIAQLAAPQEPQQDHFWRLCQAVNDSTEIWADLTGQPQNWSLFTGAWTHMTFPVIEVRWQTPDEEAHRV